MELLARSLDTFVTYIHMPYIECFPLTELAEHVELDETQIILVLLLPAVEYCVLDLFALAKVAYAVLSDREVFVFAAV